MHILECTLSNGCNSQGSHWYSLPVDGAPPRMMWGPKSRQSARLSLPVVRIGYPAPSIPSDGCPHPLVSGGGIFAWGIGGKGSQFGRRDRHDTQGKVGSLYPVAQPNPNHITSAPPLIRSSPLGALSRKPSKPSCCFLQQKIANIIQ